MPTRDECLREAAKTLVKIAIRIERDRLNSSTPDSPEASGLDPLHTAA